MERNRYLTEPDKVYKYKIIIDNAIQEKSIILIGGDADIPGWYFDTEFKSEPTAEDWENAFHEIYQLVEIANSSFEITTINIQQYNSKIDILYRSEYSMFSNQNFRKWFEEKFQLDRYDISNGDINLVFKGYIELEMGVKINCEIFEVEIGRRNNIGIIIETKNFAFLPNHPIYKQRQYEIWKLNAPRLAKVLEEFNNNTHFDLLSEAGDFGKTASISSNIYYLQNGPITGVEDENWDEFYIPFNLLNHDPSSKY